MRRARIVLWVLALVAVGLLWLTVTGAGLRFAWGLAAPWMPPELAVSSLEGRLIGPLTLRGVRFDAAAGRATVATIRFDWRPSRLLAGELNIARLTVAGVQYAAEKGDTAPAGPAVELPRLPLALVVGEARFRDIAYLPAGEDSPVRLEQAGWGGLTLDAEGLRLAALRLRLPVAGINGDLAVARGAAGGIDGRFEWRATPPDRPPASGTAVLNGDRDALRLVVEAKAPYRAAVTLRVDDPAGTPAFRLTLDARESDTRAWLGRRVADMPSRLGLRATARGQWRDGGLTLERARIERPDNGTRIDAQGRLAVGGASNLTLTWRQLAWPLVGPPAIASPAGTLRIGGAPGDWRGELRADLAPQGGVRGDVRWTKGEFHADLSWHDIRAAGLRSPEGRLAFDGRPKDYRLRLEGGFRHPRTGTVRIAASGRGDRAGITVEDLTGEALEGRFSGTGRVAWQPGWRFSGNLRGKDLNPQSLLPEWPGRLDLRLRFSGERADPGWRLAVDDLVVEGRLRQRRLAASGAGVWDGSRLRLRDLQLTSGDSRLTAAGLLGGRWDLTWRVRSPDLGDLWPGAAGRLVGEGSVRGRRPDWRLRAELDGEALNWRDWAAERVTLEAALDLSGESESAITLDGRAVGTGDGPWNLTLRGEGRPRAHRLNLGLRRTDAENAAGLTAEIEGDWRRPDWRGALVAARIQPSLGPVWTLAEPAQLGYRDGRLRVERFCLAAEPDARGCLALTVARDRIGGRVELARLPLALSEAILPPDVAVTGDLSVEGDFAYAEGQPRLNLDVRTSAARIIAPALDGTAPVLELAAGQGHVHLDRDGGALRFDVALRPEGRLRADIALGPGNGVAERSLTGEITAALPDVSAFAVFSPEVDSLAGRVDGRLALAGRVDAPSLSGELALTEGRAVLPRPGLTLTDMALRLAGEGDRMTLSGGAVSGDGRVNLSGRVRVVPSPGFDIEVTGENFRIIDTLDASVAVSSDLNLTLSDRRVLVRGTVRVPRADITPRDIRAAGAVPVSRDQIIVEAGGESRAPLGYDVEIRVVLGDRVRVEAAGLKADLGGALTLRQRPERLATATGELTIREGEYRAYGQGLRIDQGRLLFTGGPVDDPGLDVRAYRRPREDILVGVLARGSLREPDFRIFSEPAMSETRQLSWLILGRPLEETSGGESSALAQAAIGLGLKGGDFLGRRLQDTLRLDTLGVESEAGGPRDQAAFVIGKYLSPRLYLSYGIGLFEPVNVLKLRYEISRRWTLVTESGTESGADITYSIDR